MTLLNRVRITKLFFQLVQDPNRTELIFQAIKHFSSERNDPVVVKLLNEMFEDKLLQERFKEKYLGELPPIDTLATYPEGSFGRVYYDHMHSNNLKQDLFPFFDPKDRLDYVNLRMYQDHDLWHALLGYGVSLEDELAVQAFSAAQLRTPFSVMLIAGGLLHLLKSEPLRSVKAIQEVAEGFTRGTKAPMLLGFRMHDLLEKPVQEVRELCGVA